MSGVVFTGVSKSFGTVPVVRNISLRVEPGTTTVIVGSSGSGKTTLLRLISGFERPDSGSIVIGGVEVATATTSLPAHRRGVGLVSQDGSLFPHLSVADNITFGMDAAPRAARRRRATELLELVSLDRSFLARRPDELSGGQQQRVALARALAHRPSVMLLDEPFSALDTGLRESTRNAISAILREQKITTILVTHDQAEALSFGDQLAVLGDGKFRQVGSPRDVYSHPADLQTAHFLGDCVSLPAVLGEGSASCALGQVAVEVSEIRGSGSVLFRPEQLGVERVEHGGSSGNGTSSSGFGTVEQVEFLGSAQRATIRLDETLTVITVLCPGEVRAGDRVSVSAREPGRAFA